VLQLASEASRQKWELDGIAIMSWRSFICDLRPAAAPFIGDTKKKLELPLLILQFTNIFHQRTELQTEFTYHTNQANPICPPFSEKSPPSVSVERKIPVSTLFLPSK
jgi:hypothetical protein